MYRHIPNAITFARGAGGFVVAALLLGPGWNFVAFWVFIAAIASDLVDGWLARILDAKSSAGEWMDPVADKVLTDSVWLALWWVGFAPAWLAFVSLIRDIIVVSVWSWMNHRGQRAISRPIGQVVVAFEGVALSVLIFHGPWLAPHWPSVGISLAVIALVLSAVGIADQLWIQKRLQTAKNPG